MIKTEKELVDEIKAIDSLIVSKEILINTAQKHYMKLIDDRELLIQNKKSKMDILGVKYKDLMI